MGLYSKTVNYVKIRDSLLCLTLQMSTDHAANISLFISEYIWREKAFKLYCEEERREVRMFVTVSLCGRTYKEGTGRFSRPFFLFKTIPNQNLFLVIAQMSFGTVWRKIIVIVTRYEVRLSCCCYRFLFFLAKMSLSQ